MSLKRAISATSFWARRGVETSGNIILQAISFRGTGGHILRGKWAFKNMIDEADMPRQLEISLRHGLCDRCGSYKRDLTLFAKGESKIYICYDCLSATAKRVSRAINVGLRKSEI